MENKESSSGRGVKTFVTEDFSTIAVIFTTVLLPWAQLLGTLCYASIASHWESGAFSDHHPKPFSSFSSIMSICHYNSRQKWAKRKKKVVHFFVRGSFSHPLFPFDPEQENESNGPDLLCDLWGTPILHSRWRKCPQTTVHWGPYYSPHSLAAWSTRRTFCLCFLKIEE